MRPRGYQDLPLVPMRSAPDSSDAPAELLLRGFGHHLGRPRRVPHDVHDRFLDALGFLELSLYVLGGICWGGGSGGRARLAGVLLCPRPPCVDTFGRGVVPAVVPD